MTHGIENVNSWFAQRTAFEFEVLFCVLLTLIGEAINRATLIRLYHCYVYEAEISVELIKKLKLSGYESPSVVNKIAVIVR